MKQPNTKSATILGNSLPFETKRCKASVGTTTTTTGFVLLLLLLLGLFPCSKRALTGAVFVDGFMAVQPVLGSTTPRSHGACFKESSSRMSSHQEDANDSPPDNCYHIENLSIHYCPGCRWMPKAFWMATEVLQNPNYMGKLKQVTVVPSEPGTFLVSARLATKENHDNDSSQDSNSETIQQQLWDRTVDGGFPPIDLIEFEERVSACLKASADQDGNDDDDNNALGGGGDDANALVESQSFQAHVVIKYCQDSGYLLRAAYYGQELLTTFCDGELDAISLQPIESNTNNDDDLGGFSVSLHDSKNQETKRLWDKLDAGNFPQVKELKRLVRDVVTPQKDLGHSEVKANNNDNVEEKLDSVGDCIPCNTNDSASDSASDAEKEDDNDEEEDEDDGFMDDDEAEEARRYFGVM